MRTRARAFGGHIPEAGRRREPDLPGSRDEFEVSAERVLRLAFRPLDPLGRQLDGPVTQAHRLEQEFRTKLMTAVLPFHASQDIGFHQPVTKSDVVNRDAVERAKYQVVSIV